eukprot:6383627-Prymnesium_polylepis.1
MRGSPWGGGLGPWSRGGGGPGRGALARLPFHGADDESSLPAIFSRVACTASAATVATLVTTALIFTG